MAQRPNTQLYETNASGFKNYTRCGKFAIQRCLLTTEGLQYYCCARFLHIGATMRSSPAFPNNCKCPSVQRYIYILNCCLFADVSLHMYLRSSLYLLSGRDTSLLQGVNTYSAFSSRISLNPVTSLFKSGCRSA